MRTVLFLIALLLSTAIRAADPLPAMGAEPGRMTVSGLSAGGFMAVQVHVAHSSRVKGVGAVAAGPYYCAKGSLAGAYYNCREPGRFTPLPATVTLRTEAARQAQQGRIDSDMGMPGARAWLFVGTRDGTVQPEVVARLDSFYKDFEVIMRFVRDQPAGHGMPTLDAGGACAASEPPFLNACKYDAAGEMLRHLLGAAHAPAQAGGRVLRFDQREFAGGNALALSLADEGYAYVPPLCEKERCRVHIAFHGCRQHAGAVAERFVREAGYNRWADAHGLIVLYPQAAPRFGFGLGAWNYVWNPRACWDWWGYTGPLYHTKEGAQVRAVMAMADRLAAARPSGPPK